MCQHQPASKSGFLIPPHLCLSVDMLAGVIRMGGELDRTSAHHLGDALSALRSSPSPVWTLDLQELSFCDVEGMRVLDRAVGLARSCGRTLHLTMIPTALADLLALYQAPRAGESRPPERLRTPVVAVAS